MVMVSRLSSLVLLLQHMFSRDGEKSRKCIDQLPAEHVLQNMCTERGTLCGRFAKLGCISLSVRALIIVIHTSEKEELGVCSGDEMVYVAWPHRAQNLPSLTGRLGIVYCLNRPCSLYSVALPTGASPEEARHCRPCCRI